MFFAYCCDRPITFPSTAAAIISSWYCSAADATESPRDDLFFNTCGASSYSKKNIPLPRLRKFSEYFNSAYIRIPSIKCCRDRWILATAAETE